MATCISGGRARGEGRAVSRVAEAMPKQPWLAARIFFRSEAEGMGAAGEQGLAPAAPVAAGSGRTTS